MVYNRLMEFSDPELDELVEYVEALGYSVKRPDGKISISGETMSIPRAKDVLRDIRHRRGPKTLP